MKEYLPIGAVVLLKKSDKTLMIYGRKQIHLKSGIEFDYIGCLYPEGYITDELSFFFNHSDISKTLFKGFETEMDQVFQKEYLEAEVDSAFE